jgi:hypothetical protein
MYVYMCKRLDIIGKRWVKNLFEQPTAAQKNYKIKRIFLFSYFPIFL